jgi:putative transposase
MISYQDNAYKHGVGWSIWHFEWVTKYRRKVFVDSELKKLCGILLEEAGRRYKLNIEEYEVQPDHVHVLARLRPSMSPAKAVNLLKGYTSRLMFLAEPEKLEVFYYKPLEMRSLWGDGKFMASVGHITLEKAKEYMKKQEAHHANNPNGNPHPLGLGRRSSKAEIHKNKA